MNDEREELMFRSICLAAAILAGAAPAASQEPDVRWLDSFKDVRVGRADGVILAYWFGFKGDRVLVRKRVIMPGGITAEVESKAIAWAKGDPAAADLPSSPASREIWRDRRAAAARAELEAALAAEIKAGTIPRPPGWSVAPNPSSTTPPKTRPMFDRTGARQVETRAVVGDRCDCSSLKVAKGTQTLCPLAPLIRGQAPSESITACAKDPDK